MRKSILLSIIFIILSLVSYIALTYEKNQKINQFLNNKTNQYTQNYNALYFEHKKLSSMIFQTKLNTKDVQKLFKSRDRDKLFNHLKDTYSLLKQFNIKQLHFHLPNNDSFLRFHRPSKFGDNLSNARATVKYVNEVKKPIDGFEEGKIYNGYRFVFPLFNNKEHIGSVEVLFSTLAMNLTYMQNYDITSNFLISKKVVDDKVFKSEKINYMNSPFKYYYVEKKMIENIAKIRKSKTRLPVSEETKQLILKEGFTSRSFSTYDTIRKEVITFIKVKNPISQKVVGLFVVKSEAKYIHNKTKNFYISLTLVIVFLVIVWLFIYKEIIYRNKLKENEKELEYLNNNLQIEVDEAVETLRVKDNLLAQQSKMAAMGEMIDSVAHQWMQPIGIIRMKLQLLEFDLELDDVTDEKILETVQSSDKQIIHLTNTINEFRAFFRPNTKVETIPLKALVDSSLLLLNDDLIKNTIKTKIIGDDTATINVNGSEFKHIIINIINNAKDAFNDNNIDKTNRTIVFNIESLENKVVFTITDNAGGISNEIISHIFKPNFTTKEEGKGTGIGLYMTKQIIDKNNATIEVFNVDNGVCFKIEILNK